MGCAPKVRFAPDSALEGADSALEGDGFEPSVPLYGELGALGRVRRDPRRHCEARDARSFRVDALGERCGKAGVPYFVLVFAVGRVLGPIREL
jgi:hypothetical protein